MTMSGTVSWASVAASDPATAPADLARIAREWVELRPYVAMNPSADPELVAWLARLDDSVVNAALVARQRVQDAGARSPVTDVGAERRGDGRGDARSAMPDAPLSPPSPGRRAMQAARPRRILLWVAAGVAVVIVAVTVLVLNGRAGLPQLSDRADLVPYPSAPSVTWAMDVAGAVGTPGELVTGPGPYFAVLSAGSTWLVRVGDSLVALESTSGDVLWFVDMPDQAGCAIARGPALMCVRSPGDETGLLVAVDLGDGSLTPLAGLPAWARLDAVVDDKVVITSQDGIQAMDATGSLVWQVGVDELPASAEGAEHVRGLARDGHRQGVVSWYFDDPTFPGGSVIVELASGTVVGGSETFRDGHPTLVDGDAIGFSLRNGSVRLVNVDGDVSSPGAGGIYQLDTDLRGWYVQPGAPALVPVETNDELVMFETGMPDDGWISGGALPEPPVWVGKDVVVTVPVQLAEPSTLTGRAREDGAPLWEYELAWVTEPTGRVPQVLTDGVRLVARDGDDGLTALDATTGEAEWQVRTPADRFELDAVAGTLVLLTWDGSVIAYGT